MKACSKCGEIKPLDCYYRQSATKDGRRPDCKTCLNAVRKKERLEHPERVSAREKKRYDKHREKRKKASRDYGREHKAEIAAKNSWVTNPERKAAGMAYRKANRAKVLEWARSNGYKRRVLFAEKYIEDVPLDFLLVRDIGVCGICEKQIMGPLDVDHILPLAAGGTHEKANCQLAHRSCNRRKWATVGFTLADAA